MKNILLLFLVLSLAGCATSVRYTSYTNQKFVPKPRDYFLPTYPKTQRLPEPLKYIVIGTLEISGYASNGVDDQELTQQSKTISRKKGADAIINASIHAYDYSGVRIYPEHISYHPVTVSEYVYSVDNQTPTRILETDYVPAYHPPEYIPYKDTLFKFRGDLVVFTKSLFSPQGNSQSREEPPSKL